MSSLLFTPFFVATFLVCDRLLMSILESLELFVDCLDSLFLCAFEEIEGTRFDFCS